MKKVITLALLSTLAYSAPKQFPEENYTYRPRVDKGMGKYKSKSMVGSNKLVLTYDDGPKTTTTPKILDVLKEFNAKATFFVLTEKINEKTMPIIKRIIDEGHILASHDHNHSNNNNETKAEFVRELKQTVRAIEKIQDDNGTNPVELYYRFPYGAYGMSKAYHHMNAMKEVSQELYGENCINFAFWDIDTADWVPNITASDVAQGIRAHMEGGIAFTHKKVTLSNGKTTYRKSGFRIPKEKAIGGGVVLMHDIHAKNIESTRLILKEAKEKGWEIVPLNEVKEYMYSAEKTCALK